MTDGNTDDWQASLKEPSDPIYSAAIASTGPQLWRKTEWMRAANACASERVYFDWLAMLHPDDRKFVEAHKELFLWACGMAFHVGAAWRRKYTEREPGQDG